MSKHYISPALREKIAEEARYRCGYCLAQVKIVGDIFEIEHIMPKAQGGTSITENLWLACSRCNRHKSVKIDAIDPKSKQRVPLFNPRKQNWHDHFLWTHDGTWITGKSAIGRGTIDALKLNRPLLVSARYYWVSAGWHPPEE